MAIKKPDFPVVGIGTSAGGIKALKHSTMLRRLQRRVQVTGIYIYPAFDRYKK